MLSLAMLPSFFQFPGGAVGLAYFAGDRRLATGETTLSLLCCCLSCQRVNDSLMDWLTAGLPACWLAGLFAC